MNKILDDSLNGVLQKQILELYPHQITQEVQERYKRLAHGFLEIVQNKSDEVALFSAPGRTELGGNHTDHQGGCVLAGSVDLDVAGIAAPNQTKTVRIYSEGYGMIEVFIGELAPKKTEENTTAALIRGIAAQYVQLGFDVSGFDGYIHSNVLSGSGLSSSAAFEVWVGAVFNTFFCKSVLSAVQIAQIGQYAENHYFGKPCGLMDQLASAVGGVVSIDFGEKEHPLVQTIPAQFGEYDLFIIDSGANHADLTQEYAAITQEMGEVATFFGKKLLHELSKTDVLEHSRQLRKTCGDRAVLRALHYFDETNRVPRQAEALRRGDIPMFLQLVSQSGRSSYMYLQNIYKTGAVRNQEVAVCLMLVDQILDGEGAFRVHGGGFAGTVQAFVPRNKRDEFKKKIEQALGQGSCHLLSIRKKGIVAIR